MSTDSNSSTPTPLEWRYGRPTTDATLGALELQLDFTLPADFRAVALLQDGGRPRPQGVRISEDRNAVFERLLATEPNHGDTLLEAAQDMQANGRTDLIPFATDPFGNAFCFRREPDTGKAIVFWDHEADTVYELCNGFMELLSMLQEPD